MRFSSLIDDPKSFEDLLQATTSATRFSENERIALKIFPDAVYFVCKTPMRHSGYFMEIRLLEAEIFSSYKMEGISTEKNYIIMTMAGSDFAKVVQNNVEKVRLKLIKRDTQPTLKAEVALDDELSKFIPVSICKSSDVVDFWTPTVNPPIVGLSIKQIDSFKEIIGTLYELGIETVEMQLFPDGELHIRAETESRAEYNIIFDELVVLDEIEGAEESDVFRVRVINIHNFLGCLPQDAKRFSIRVSDLNQIIISVKHSNLEYLFYMSSLIPEQE